MNVAKRAALRALANQRVAGFLGIETKFYDTMLVDRAILAPTDASGGEADPSATSMISTPAQGDTEQNRDGKKIVIKNVQVKGSVQKQTIELGANPPGGQTVFVALVLDTQSNGAQMNSEDCFKNTTADTGSAPNVMRNLLFSSRFRVLKSQIFHLDVPISHFAVDSFSSPGIRREFDWFIPLNLNVNFNAGTTASIANVIDNSLHMICYTNSTNGTPLLNYNARIRFQG